MNNKRRSKPKTPVFVLFTVHYSPFTIPFFPVIIHHLLFTIHRTAAKRRIPRLIPRRKESLPMKKRLFFTLAISLAFAIPLSFVLTSCGGKTPGESHSSGPDFSAGPGNSSEPGSHAKESSAPGEISGETSYPEELYADGHFSEYDLDTSYSSADTSITLSQGGSPSAVPAPWRTKKP